MPKLNQIVAVEKGAKSHLEDAVTQAYTIAGKPDLFTGFSRTYEPKAEDGDRLPGEQKFVQVTVEQIVKQFTDASVNLADVTATKVWANTEAKADVVVDGETIVVGAPVEYLLFLETQCQRMLQFLSKLPTLDPAKRWKVDSNTGLQVTEPVNNIRNKKIPRNHVVAEATDKHPAQVQVYMEDVPEGTWTVVDHSGAVPATQVKEWVAKVHKLAEAVKFAREEANSIDAEQRHVGEAFFNYVFG